MPKHMYANVVSTLALVVALGGTGAYAAGLAKNSVGSRQIKNNSVTGKDVKESSLVLPTPVLVGDSVIVGGAVTSGSLSGSLATVASAQLTAPRDGIAMVTLEAEFSAEDDDGFVTGELHVDGVRADVFEMDPGDTDALFDQRQTVTVVLPVTAGAHRYDLQLVDEAGPAPFTQYTEAHVVVQFAPHGVAGPGVG